MSRPGNELRATVSPTKFAIEPPLIAQGVEEGEVCRRLGVGELLGLVDRAPGLKRVFIREAAGLVGEVPKLLKGEAL